MDSLLPTADTTRTDKRPDKRANEVDEDATDAQGRPSKTARHETTMTPSTESTQALSAWLRKFTDRQIRLTRDDPEPFKAGRRLGGGGIGIVHETRLDDIPLALKRTYARRLTDHQLNEIKVLGRISEERHHHIVELVGSYIHRQRSGYELGLLIWPVAHCDLATFLHDLDILEDYSSYSHGIGAYHVELDEMSNALESVSILLNKKPQPLSFETVAAIAEEAQFRLEASFGCIATALAYLHSKDIRHKDLKPSQILMSPHGLWLTDFGWARDMSEYTHSGTSEGDHINTKYQSPERARKETCRQSEDIFALGCIFAEMSYYTTTTWPSRKTLVRPWTQKGWSWQENLVFVHNSYLLPSQTNDKDWNTGSSFFRDIIREMLSFDPDCRPSIGHIVQRLVAIEPPRFLGARMLFFGWCCSATLAMFHPFGSTRGPSRYAAQRPRVKDTYSLNTL